ncbi:hypothetical protein LCGC14_3097980 [marine sediment metagenome]|uniref:Uncharacterized protein n=1 Tax=marine sediment metagenome TaxID=412755 RepID=A0A0F8YG10_9ZZZZ
MTAYFVTFIVLAFAMTWFCHIRRNSLLTSATMILWLALAMGLFFGGTPILALGTLWVDIIAWFFFTMMWVPLLLQMDTEITHEKNGRRWKQWSTEAPEGRGPTAYEDYRDKLYGRTRKGR